MKKIRRSMGLTQKEISVITGIGQGKISEYESGKTKPTLVTAAKIAQAFGKTIEEVFDLKDILNNSTRKAG